MSLKSVKVDAYQVDFMRRFLKVHYFITFTKNGERLRGYAYGYKKARRHAVALSDYWVNKVIK